MLKSGRFYHNVATLGLTQWLKKDLFWVTFCGPDANHAPCSMSQPLRNMLEDTEPYPHRGVGTHHIPSTQRTIAQWFPML